MFCLITGSSRGLGREIALALGRDGHHIAVHYKDSEDRAKTVASRIKSAIVLKADVRESEEVSLLVDDLLKKWGRIDLLVNNAGITKEALLLKTSVDLFDEVLSAYSASKGGLVGLTLSSAVELAKYNIMVNMVLPGYMLTDMGRASGNKAREAALKDSLLDEYASPETVAEFIRYLAGTTGITGQVFNMDSRMI
jgi:3-oxoacyl-[acyl-carrier protein] reductase